MRILITLWALFGVFLIIGRAFWRLSEIAIEGIFGGEPPMTSLHWGALFIWTIIIAYSEGYRGFQMKFSPRTVARAWYMAEHPTALRLILAPLFTMGFFDANRKTKLTAYIMVFLIVSLVMVVSQIPQPWRGIIDGGVVIGLGWGLISILVIFVRSFLNGHQHLDPCMPSDAHQVAEPDDTLTS